MLASHPFRMTPILAKLTVAASLTLCGCSQDPEIPASVANSTATDAASLQGSSSNDSDASEDGNLSIADEELSSTWAAAVAEVAAGTSSSIQIIDGVIQDNQVLELSQLGEGKLLDLLIDRGRLSDSAMTAIGNLKGLEHLRLRLCPISDAGFAAFARGGNPALRILNVPQSTISAKGIRELAAFTKLVQLRIGGRQLDDAAMEEIASLPSLKMLHLIGPGISDEGLLALAKAPKLTSLYIDDCPLADEAWVKLFGAVPNLHVHVDQLHHDRDPAKH